MFRSKVKQRRIFSNRRRVRRRFPWFGAIASLALLLLALELLTRIFVDLAGNRSQFTGSEGGSDITQAYQLDFVSPEIGIALGARAVFWTAMPKAAVDEDG